MSLKHSNGPAAALTLLLVSLTGLLPASLAHAATMLQDCFHSVPGYLTYLEYDLPASQNTVGNSSLSQHKVAVGPALTASCECPDSLKSNARIYSATHAGSTLAAGHTSGYGLLTSNLDIDVSGYTDAINSPTGSGLFQINIDQYPMTDISRMKSDSSGISTQEQTATVCRQGTGPGITTNQRQFKWNVINATIYLKHSILGEEIIPPTIVAQNYACLAEGALYSCPAGSAQLVSNISLAGRITAPLSCIINAGSTIEVNLGSVPKASFVAAGQLPTGYTLKSADVSYHCDNPAVANSGKIKMTLTADQGVSDSSTGLIARMIDRDDIGVRMYDRDGKNVVLDGSVDLPITLDEQGNGTVKFTAAPVSTTSAQPQPGLYGGNVTVKMDIR